MSAHEGERDEHDPRRGQRASVVVLVGVILLGLAGALPMLAQFDLHLAWEGWGARDYVQQRLSPDAYAVQFPSGVLNYDSSLVMQTYRAIGAVAGALPADAVHVGVVLEHLIFALGAALFIHALFARRVLTVIGAIVMLTSPLAGINLARYHGFGLAGGEHGLFYLTAYGTMFAALAATLRGRLALAGVLFAATVWMHLLIGFYGIAFAGAALLARPRWLATRSALIGACAFVVIALPHILRIAGASSGGGDGIDSEAWIRATRVFSSHWYPADLQQFGALAHRRFVPIVLLLLVSLHALPRTVRFANDPGLGRMLRSGMAMCVVLTLAGIAIAQWSSSPTLIKLCLHRASFLATAVAALVSVAWLVDTIRRGPVVAAPFAAWGLIAMVTSTPGFAIVPIVAVFAIDVWTDDRPPRWRWTLLGGAAAVFVALIVLTIGGISRPGWYTVLWTPLQRIGPWAKQADLALLGGALMAGMTWVTLVIGACATILLLRIPVPHAGRLALLVGAGVVVVALPRVEREAAWHERHGASAEAYLEIQQWAQRETEPGTLFLTDPTRDYGWRDFADRPNTSSHREWGYASYLYDSDPASFDAGMARLARFGVDLDVIARDAIESDAPMGRVRRSIRDTIGAQYAALDVAALQDFVDHWGVAYAVFDKGGFGDVAFTPRPLSIAAENEHFVVYELPAPRDGEPARDE